MSWGGFLRLLLHLPHGMIAGWIIFGCPIPFLLSIMPTLVYALIGIAVYLGFIIRQAMQDYGEEHGSWNDVIGIVWSFAGIAALLIIMERLL